MQAAAGKRWGLSKRARERLLPYAYLFLPMLVILGLILYPILTVFYYSLFDYFPARPYLNGFVGIQNFIDILSDELFAQSLLVSLKWVGTQVPLQLLLGMGLALLLNQKFRGRGLIRGVTFGPWSLSGVIVAILWSLIFNGNMGVLNDLLQRMDLLEKPVAWLSNPNTAFAAVCVAELWRGVPFFAISLLAALQSVPGELYESCDIDGGGRLSQFWYITLPFIKSTVVLTTLLRAVWEFNAVDVIMIATGGGPLGRTTTLSIYLADLAMENRNFGYGSAVGVVSFCILFVFAMAYLRASRFGGGEQ